MWQLFHFCRQEEETGLSGSAAGGVTWRRQVDGRGAEGGSGYLHVRGEEISSKCHNIDSTSGCFDATGEGDEMSNEMFWKPYNDDVYKSYLHFVTLK